MGLRRNALEWAAEGSRDSVKPGLPADHPDFLPHPPPDLYRPGYAAERY
jgi:hypothetical protein